MTTIDKSGSSVEEIIRKFRSKNDIQDHELKYEILKRPSKGFFGLFANKVALVRFHLPESSDRIRLYLETLLSKMGVSFGSIKTKTEDKTLYLFIEDVVEAGFVIGKNGSMLETLQYMINRVFENDTKIDRIYLDADGYRERREQQFLRKYLSRINKVKIHGKSITLDPMNPGERRIIHRHIEGDRGLRTLTIGEGGNKRIVVFSSKLKESEVLQGKNRPEKRRTQRPRRKQKATFDADQTDGKPRTKGRAPRKTRPRSRHRQQKEKKTD